jgi:hypothetical protein
MLCERCQRHEAAVYQTWVIWRAAEVTQQELCEPCYAEVGLEKLEHYEPADPAPTLPTDLASINVEQITAAQYLKAHEEARKTAGDTPVFKHLSNELARLPGTRCRLAFEFFQMAADTLERGGHPGYLIAISGMFFNSAGPAQLREYAALVEQLMRRIVKLVREVATPVQMGKHSSLDPSPKMIWSLVFAAVNLKRIDQNRYAAVMQEFKETADKPGFVHRSVIAFVEERIEGMEKNKG